MPNWCVYQGRIKGKKDNVLEFLHRWGAYYKYPYKNDEDQRPIITYAVGDRDIDEPVDCHIGYRVNKECEEEVCERNGEVIYEFCGDVAWSLESCVIEGSEKGHYITPTNRIDTCITVDEACKRFNVEVELISTENDIGFAEHYHILPNGAFITDESQGYCSLCHDCFDELETYDDFIKVYPELKLTEEQFMLLQDGKEVEIWEDAKYVFEMKLEL